MRDGNNLRSLLAISWVLHESGETMYPRLQLLATLLKFLGAESRTPAISKVWYEAATNYESTAICYTPIRRNHKASLGFTVEEGLGFSPSRGMLPPHVAPQRLLGRSYLSGQIREATNDHSIYEYGLAAPEGTYYFRNPPSSHR